MLFNNIHLKCSCRKCVFDNNIRCVRFLNFNASVLYWHDKIYIRIAKAFAGGLRTNSVFIQTALSTLSVKTTGAAHFVNLLRFI